jgi:hypothetical protein
LGEFSNIGGLFTLGSFLKSMKIARIFGLIFFHRKSYEFILTNNIFGYIMGAIFTSSSGHNVARRHSAEASKTHNQVLNFM